MVQEEHIQITVLIIVKKTRLGGITHVGQPELFSPFRKSKVTIVDKKQVLPVIWIIGRRTAYINIQEAIAVHIGHGGTRVPQARRFDAGIYGYIFEFPVPLFRY